MGGKPRAPSRVGQVFAVPVRGGRWTACQILWESRTEVEIVELEYLDTEQPSLEDVAGAGVRARFRVSETVVPRRFVPLGTAPVPGFDERSKAWSGWWSIPVGALGREHRANRPPAVRDAIAAVTREPIELALGDGEPTVVRHDTWRLSVEGDSIRWEALDALPGLIDLTYTGRDRGVLDYARSRYTIRRLTWIGGGEARIDASGCGLTRLRLESAVPLERLAVDSELETLSLEHDGGAGLTVEHPGDGHELELHLYSHPERPLALPAGLPRLSGLDVAAPRRIALAPFARFEHLASIDLHLDAGAIDDVEILGGFSNLRVLEMRECFDYDAASFPRAAEAWPEIEAVRIYGFRKSAGGELKERLTGVPVVVLRGGKTDAWLAKHARNPFRDWIDRDTKLGKAACKAYVDAVGGIEKAADREGVRAVLDAMVVRFNELDESYGLDTVDREEVAGAYFGLGEKAGERIGLGIEEGELEQWFDGLREF